MPGNMRAYTATQGSIETTKAYNTRTAESCCAYFIPCMKPDFTILDVGCGPGSISADLAHLVPGGTVTVVDISPGVIGKARGGVPRRRVSQPLLRCSDAQLLAQFPDARFNVVHANAVVCHCVDPVAALQAMLRVCKPGGVVATRDPSYPVEMYRIEPAVPGFRDAWHVIRKYVDTGGTHMDVGLHKERWAKEAWGDKCNIVKSESWQWLLNMPFILAGGTKEANLAVEKGIATTEELKTYEET